MVDPRWIPLEEYRDAIAADLDLAVRIWDMTPTGGPDRSIIQEKAFQKALQDAYSTFEQAALYALKLAGEARPSGEGWHEHLLMMVTRPTEARPALAADLVKSLRQLRRFRHVAMHAYLDFEMAKADHTVAAARVLLAELPDALDRFGRAFGLLSPKAP